MIKNLFVEGLNNRKKPLNLDFHSDLNLFTGKNGSSKTTLLKLIWYMNSARFFSLVKEINFQNAILTTSTSKLQIKREQEARIVTFIINDEKPFSLSELNLRELEIRRSVRVDEKFTNIQKNSIPTIFFPTFRRIEGGFSMDYDQLTGRGDEVRNAMEQLSRRLSMQNHKFITSISTDDIVLLLNREYSVINANISTTQKVKSDEIIKKIKNKSQDEKVILVEIQKDIEFMESERERLLKPYTTLSNLIIKIFQHKGINLSNLTIGEVNNSISSDKLSAGEKQMLSFICYNAFTKNQTIFIDEPELSLHPDWQRTLVPTLLNQGSDNQFFMATHSPFIFSKYSVKRLCYLTIKASNMSLQLTVDEIVDTLKRSSLTTVLVEGKDDVMIYRWIENEIGIENANFLPCGGRRNLLEIFDRRAEFSNLKTVFVADKDAFVYLNPPEEYNEVIWTNGYSIENDLYHGRKIETLMSEDENEIFLKSLNSFIEYYAFEIDKLRNGQDACFRYHPNQIIDELSHEIKQEFLAEINFVAPNHNTKIELEDNYDILIRGKSLFALLTRILSHSKREIKHSKNSLLEHCYRTHKSEMFFNLTEQIRSKICA